MEILATEEINKDQVDERHSPAFLNLIAKEAGCAVGDIQDFDLTVSAIDSEVSAVSNGWPPEDCSSCLLFSQFPREHLCLPSSDQCLAVLAEISFATHSLAQPGE